MEPTVVLQLAALIDSRFDSLRDEIRADANSWKEDVRESVNSWEEDVRASVNSWEEDVRASVNSWEEDVRASARSVRKERRFLAAGVGTVMVTGFLYLNASLTDLSVALARVETELALLLERVPIQ